MNIRPLFSFLTLLIVICLSSAQAQTPLAEAARKAEKWPQWPGCTEKDKNCTKAKLDEFIAANLKMPEETKNQAIGGVVMVEFVIEKNGTIGEVSTLHDPGSGLGREAMAVIRMMTDKKIKWEAAEENGKRIPFRYITPVSFNVEKPVEVKVIPAETTSEEPAVYDVVDVMPQYAGCQVALTDTIDCTFLKMINHIQTNLKYPDSAFAVGAQGPVVVEFVIDPSGQITNPRVTKGLGHGLDEEALRVVSLMPAWQPGIHNGKPVPVRMVVPIMFQIPKGDKG